MKNVKDMTYEELSAIWEAELLVAKIDPFTEVPEYVAEVLQELADREDKYLDILSEYQIMLNNKGDPQ